MGEAFALIAQSREDQGKAASRRLRREGKVPAIIYGAGRPPRALSFDHNKVLRQLENESFYSSVLNIKVGEKSQAAILKDLQRHPAKNLILHMDLQRIVDDEAIRMNVPLRFIGEDLAPGIKLGGGTVAHLMSDVEVTCLPKDLPEFIEVDISTLELDQMVHLSALKLPPGVEIPALAQGAEHDQAIVSIHVIKVPAVPEPDDAQAAQGSNDAEAAGQQAAE